MSSASKTWSSPLTSPGSISWSGKNIPSLHNPKPQIWTPVPIGLWTVSNRMETVIFSDEVLVSFMYSAKEKISSLSTRPETTTVSPSVMVFPFASNLKFCARTKPIPAKARIIETAIFLMIIFIYCFCLYFK